MEKLFLTPIVNLVFGNRKKVLYWIFLKGVKSTV